jgi:hypothetical protein
VLRFSNYLIYQILFLIISMLIFYLDLISSDFLAYYPHWILGLLSFNHNICFWLINF